ncbi:hypothetical protein BC835DRAFT_903639 [Cytidiella melzeri]|nr:hypothetical protein BC835DRAFT_903639 [Cytidiella melzeri]
MMFANSKCASAEWAKSLTEVSFLKCLEADDVHCTFWDGVPHQTTCQWLLRLKPINVYTFLRASRFLILADFQPERRLDSSTVSFSDQDQMIVNRRWYKSLTPLCVSPSCNGSEQRACAGSSHEVAACDRLVYEPHPRQKVYFLSVFAAAAGLLGGRGDRLCR